MKGGNATAAARTDMLVGSCNTYSHLYITSEREVKRSRAGERTSQIIVPSVPIYFLGKFRSENFEPQCQNVAVFVGPCHHGMARPQVANGRTASDVEGSCE